MPAENCRAHGTYLQWGELDIVNGTLTRFEETPEYDSSHTDAIGVTFTFTVRGYVTADNPSSFMFAWGLAGATVPSKIRGVARNVWLPRQTLILTMDGVTVLEVYNHSPQQARAGQLDINNGPRCLDFRIEQMFGAKSAQCSITLQTTVIPCATGGQLRALNNRWSVEESVDSDWFTTRTLSGVVRVGHIDAWDNALKTMVLPRLPPGFRVEKMDFGRSKTGLELTYQIAMRQMASAPPWPASEWRCRVSEKVGISGGVSDFQFSCSLKGYAGVPKGDLFIIAIKTLILRMGNRAEQAKVPFLIKGAEVVDHLDSNLLEFSCFGQRQWKGNEPLIAGAGITNWLDLVWSRLGLLPPIDLVNDQAMNTPRTSDKTPFTDPWLYPDPAILGALTDSIPSIFMMRLTNPCVGANFPEGVPAGQAEDQQQPDDVPQTSQRDYPGQTQSSPGEQVPANVNETQANDFLTEVQLQNRYITDWGRVALPFSYRRNAKDPTCIVRRTHQPIPKRVIWYKAERFNSKPMIPKAREIFTDSNGINHFLDISEVLPSPPALTSDGVNYTYSIELRLEYWMDRPINDDEKHEPGSLPWDTSTPGGNAYLLSETESEDIV